MVSCGHVPVTIFSERLPTAWIKKKMFLRLLCALLCVWVHRYWSIKNQRKSMDFGREGGCGGPYLAAPPTSARVQNRVEFVELARDMSSNCTGDVQAGTGISRWCQLSGCGTSSYHVTCSMNISTGICDCVRTHCGVRMAYHTWYLGAGITLLLLLMSWH